MTTEKSEQHAYKGETTKLLSLSVAQIHHSLTEGNNSIDALTDSFQNLAKIGLKVEQLAAEKNEDNINEMFSLSENLSSEVNSAIVAFQFYDRLTQRLEHVANSLEQLSSLVAKHDNDGDKADKEEWHALRQLIKSKYTMEAEHNMFDAIMAGSSVKDALDLFLHSAASESDLDDIELF